jgi:glycosyltransferase involved in cell wall biosynthesis
MKLPRIALFSDSSYEANDVARTAIAIEACANMASGVPVVAMAGSGQSRTVEPGQSAVLASDRKSFVLEVRALVKNRERREGMAATARVRATDLLSRDSFFQSVCNAYDAAMSAAAGEGRNRCVLSPA